MRHQIDLATWPRREHFAFFSSFEEPFFGLVADVDVTVARAEARRLGVSFFLYYLYQALAAANSVAEFRDRIEQGQVYRYDQVHASATIGRPDHTFGFSFLENQPSLTEFLATAQPEIAAVQQASGLCLSERTGRPDVLHCSAIPWVRFTGLTHARSFGHPDSAPKISFGQAYPHGAGQRMAVSVNVHHALADGYHVGLFLDDFQRRLNG
ncbi:MAG: CatA-like O-acetyltransferase [Janthinobacterium lividum]